MIRDHFPKNSSADCNRSGSSKIVAANVMNVAGSKMTENKDCGDRKRVLCLYLFCFVLRASIEKLETRVAGTVPGSCGVLRANWLRHPKSTNCNTCCS